MVLKEIRSNAHNVASPLATTLAARGALTDTVKFGVRGCTFLRSLDQVTINLLVHQSEFTERTARSRRVHLFASIVRVFCLILGRSIEFPFKDVKLSRLDHVEKVTGSTLLNDNFARLNLDFAHRREDVPLLIFIEVAEEEILPDSLPDPLKLSVRLDRLRRRLGGTV
jgi:hypothetical protein